MKIVGVQYHTGDGVYAAKVYNYYVADDIELEPGEVIKVPAGSGKTTAKVSQINVDESSISEKVRPYMKTITTKE